MSALIPYMEYFLGANTGSGFRSYFADSYDPSDGWQVWIIKGGPGTGKSTAMRMVAEEAERRGIYHERCRCSSDPDSLDAVIIPSMRRAVYDGTAPHVMEPRLVGACEKLVNFGDAWDCGALREHSNEIRELNEACTRCHAAAQRWLAAADAFREDVFSASRSVCDMTKIERCASRLASGFAEGRGSGCGRRGIRLLTAVTLRGANGVFSPGERIIEKYENRLTISDRVGAPSASLLGMLADKLSTRGYDMTVCVCSQSGRPEHIIVPELSLAVSVSNDMHSFSGNRRTIHCERFMDTDFFATQRKRLSACRRGVREMTALASEEMRAAKALHDRLERHYAAAMDFTKASEYADRLTVEMLA